MEKILTGDKNIDSIILNNLNDKDLFRICLTGNYGKELCNYEPFWYNRLKTRFPYFLENMPQKYKSSKNYYTYLVKTISQILENMNIRNVKNISQDTLKDLLVFLKNDALIWATKQKEEHSEIVKYLVQNGAYMHKHNGWILADASERGHLEIVKYLVQNGADANASNGRPLISASRMGHLELFSTKRS